MTARAASLALLLTLGIAVAGCSAPAPAPSPTPTGFADDAAAFAAAEATYRAYVDALNRVDLSDPTTFEEVYAWTTGDALSDARKSFPNMRAEGLSVSGATQFNSFEHRAAASAETGVTVVAGLCLDVTNVRLVNADGTSATPVDRPDEQPVEVTFITAHSPTGLLITSSLAEETARCEP